MHSRGYHASNFAAYARRSNILSFTNDALIVNKSKYICQYDIILQVEASKMTLDRMHLIFLYWQH